MQAGETHLSKEHDAKSRLEGNSKSGSHSLTTIALVGGFKTSFIPTPYGQIGLVIPASFPPAELTALLDGLRLYFQGSCSTEGEGS